MSSTYYDTSYQPGLWDGRTDADTGEAFFDPRVTAQNAPNAAMLTSYGFRADPQTAWTTGQGIFINASMRFYWNGTTWVAGIAAAAADEPEVQPQAPTGPVGESTGPGGTEPTPDAPEAPEAPAGKEEST